MGDENFNHHGLTALDQMLAKEKANLSRHRRRRRVDDLLEQIRLMLAGFLGFAVLMGACWLVQERHPFDSTPHWDVILAFTACIAGVSLIGAKYVEVRERRTRARALPNMEAENAYASEIRRLESAIGQRAAERAALEEKKAIDNASRRGRARSATSKRI